MDDPAFEAFKRRRLQALSLINLADIITHPINAQFFTGIYREDVEKADKNSIVDLILRTPEAHIDSNVIPDFIQEPRRNTFDRLREILEATKVKRQDDLQRISTEDLKKVILMGINRVFFDGYTLENISEMSRENLIKLISNYPNCTLTGNPSDSSYDPGKWKPKPNQVEHIERMSRGLLSSTNESRCVWDGSDTGLGKTVSAILTAINLKIRFILVICPKKMIKKWDQALRPIGLFNYRLTTYSGITGAGGRTATRWTKYKNDPYNTDQGADNDWVKITPSGLTGKKKNFYDWSFLPDSEPGYPLGGCLVIWDEVQNAKSGKSTLIGICFDHFIQYLKSEPRKYVRSLLLSASIMETHKDLPYIMNALGYISESSARSLNAFVNSELKARFRDLIGKDWDPKYELLRDTKDRLLVFLRIVGKRDLKFSQIPPRLPFILHKLKYISIPDMPSMNKFLTNTLLPNFQKLMEADYKPIYETKLPKDKLLLFLSHLAKNPRYRDLNIQSIVDTSFPNPITFQGMTIKDEDIDKFISINREIQNMLIEMVRNEGAQDVGAMGRIQKILSKLEVIKLTPFTELAVRTLNEPLPGGAKGSVTISMIRNKSVRYFAWRLEAVLWIQHLQTKNVSADQLASIKESLISAILREYETYLATEAVALASGGKLQLKRAFERYSRAQLDSMAWVDLVFEYNKWIKYLNVNSFEYVCIYVANFGDSNTSDFDLTSADPDDWIKESKAVKSKDNDRMLEMFQKNQRRVFLTNMFISREGIDLHDTSEGGMFPRTAIISPGIVARFLLQMLGRFVREGQTSNAVRIVGFIDDVQGTRSWEAIFMEKLGNKVKDIEVLHNGEISLDIADNIDKDGKAIFKSILDDIKSGKLSIDSSAKSVGTGPAESSMLPIRRAAITGQMFEHTSTKKSPGQLSPPVGSIIPSKSIMPAPVVKAPITLPMRTEQNYIYFDVAAFEYSDADRIMQTIIGVLKNINLDPRYYTTVSKDDVNIHGVLIYRPGFLVAGLSQTAMVAQVQTQTGLSVVQTNEDLTAIVGTALVKDGENDFNPVLVVDQLVVMFESLTSMYVQPKYPISTMIPTSLLGNSLSIEPSDPRSTVMKFVGTTPKIMLAFYAIRAISLFQAPETFVSFVLQDPVGITNVMDPRYFIRNILVDDEYRLIAHTEIIRGLPLAISGVARLVPLIRNGEVFDVKSLKDEGNETSSIKVMPGYYDFFNQLLFREPEVLEKK